MSRSTKTWALAAVLLASAPITVVCDLPGLDDVLYFEPYCDACYYDGYDECGWHGCDDHWFLDFDWWW